MINLVKKFLSSLQKNYKTLILAFLLAFVFWIIVSVQISSSIEDKINGIPIEAQITEYMAQNNLQIVSDIRETVNISIEGKRYDISGLSASDFSAFVNLSSVRAAGSYVLPLTVTAKSNRNFTIINTEPNTITLNIDEIITKEFSIYGTADISLPEGYYAAEIVTSPQTIALTGSASTINKIQRVEAQSTYHGEISESQQTGSDLIFYGAGDTKIQADNIQKSVDSVSVNIPIYKQKELPLMLTIKDYPNNFDIESLQYDIQPKTLIVASPDEAIDNLSELNIGSIDISDIELNKNSFIPIVLPDGYRNLSGNNNARIEWKINDYGKLDFTVERKNINIINKPDNFNVTLITNALDLTLIGPSDKLSNITANDITVTVNLLGSSLHEGAQDVSVSVQIKGTRQQCWATGEYKVTVNASVPTESEQSE